MLDPKKYVRFADVVRAIRRENHLSQRDMARSLHVSPGYVGQWELTISKPSSELIERMCHTFSISDVDYVLRLAFAQSAPQFLRESIIHSQANGTENPVERDLLSEMRRLSPDKQTLLVEKVKFWVDAMLRDN